MVDFRVGLPTLAVKPTNQKITSFLKKLNLNFNVSLFFKVAQANTYIETTSNKADILHYHLKNKSPDEICEAYLQDIKSMINKHLFPTVKIAVDYANENFYGNTSSLFLHGWTGENGVKAHFQYFVASVVNPRKNEKIPFFIAPVRIGHSKKDLLQEMFLEAKKLFRRVDLVLLDRGFYSGEVIQFFNSKNIKFLMLVPKNEHFVKMFEHFDDMSSLYKEIKWKSNFSSQKTESKYVLIRHNFNWIFATNLEEVNAEDYIRKYKWRWQIETNFRVHDEARIKSKSVNYVIRLFYFIISMLMMFIWQMKEKTCMTFKRFLIENYEASLIKNIIVSKS